MMVGFARGVADRPSIAGWLQPAFSCCFVRSNEGGIMANRKSFKVAAVGISFALAGAFWAGGVLAQQALGKVSWKMQSAFASSLPHLGPSGVRFSKDIERMSGGQFEIKFFEPGALIPPLECFDSV